MARSGECASLEQPAGEMGFDGTLTHKACAIHQPHVQGSVLENGAPVDKEAQMRAFPTVPL